jgi:hypothetical protein
MSKKFLTPVNLPSGTENPSSGNAGDLFYREDLKVIVSYDGTQWGVPATGTSTEDVLNILVELGIVTGDGGSASASSSIDGGTPGTTGFSLAADTINVDGGTPGTTEFVFNYAAEEL